MSRHATECGRGKPFRPSNRNICRTMAVFVRQKRAISSAYDRSSLGGVESDLHTTCARETASRRRRPSRREFARHTKCCVDSPSPIPCALRRVCRWESARTGRDFVATYFFAIITDSLLAYRRPRSLVQFVSELFESQSSLFLVADVHENLSKSRRDHLGAPRSRGTINVAVFFPFLK